MQNYYEIKEIELENTKFKIRDGFLNGTTLKNHCLSAGVFLFIGLSGVIRKVGLKQPVY